MKILVINSGSSSLKYQLIDMQNEKVLARGICEKIGSDESIVRQSNYENKKIHNIMNNIQTYDDAFEQVIKMLLDNSAGAIKDLTEITSVGHRVVHGGEVFKKSVILDDDAIKEIENLIPLAPLHNPANLSGILACKKIFGNNVPQIAVFDTAFYSTLPPEAYMFAIPYEYYEKHGIRKYGFHGTSHKFVSTRCAEIMGKDISKLKIITCHLGNGASIAAINGGKAVDTTMGLTPLGGFMMGTRSGSLDPSIVTHVAQKESLSLSEVEKILNKKSGLLGISGVSNDAREITEAANSGNERAILAQQMFAYQIAKYIGGYMFVLGGCDALVFTGGIGENHYIHRKNICNNLTFANIEIDETLNNNSKEGLEKKISSNRSKLDIYVIPTNEELAIAKDTLQLLR